MWSKVAGLCALALARSVAAGPCDGPAPEAGARVQGPVLQIPDANTICIATSPTRWVRVTVGDLNADQKTLMSQLFTRTVRCEIKKTGPAACWLDGLPLSRAVSNRTAAGLTR